MTCTVCSKRSYSAYCVAHKPRKPIVSKAPKTNVRTFSTLPVRKPLPRPTKRIKKVGKHGDLWQQAKAQWFKKNYKQHYKCFYCGTLLTNATITLDHKLSRARHPELRYNLDNLTPACYDCNGKKGSKSDEEFINSMQS